MTVNQNQYAVAMDTDPASGYPMPKVSADITQVDAVVPVDIQNRLQQTIQTHNAVSVALSGSSVGSYIDTNGFDSISVTMMNDGNTNSSAMIYWSNDGTNEHGSDNIIAGSATRYQSGNVTTKARYAAVVIFNNDASAPHTMSAWAYLKS